MDRPTLREKFIQLQKENKKAFIVYVPFGFPNILFSEEIILLLYEAGVDIIELGIAFSDPIADGPIIQEAYNIALRNNANIERLFFSLKKLRKIKIPIVLMSYYNPIFRFGIEKFFKTFSSVGINGIITVDLPYDEDKKYLKTARDFKIETVFLITPTTTLKRAEEIVKETEGFIYYVSVTGITGPRELEFDFLRRCIKNLRKITSLPICVGFGIHNPQQIREINTFCDGVVIGSSIVKFIKENFTKNTFFKQLRDYINYLKNF